MSILEEKTSVFQREIEDLYQKRTNLFDLNEIKERLQIDEREMILGTVEEIFHGYNIRIPVIEGVIELKETPRLIYDGRSEKYFLEITREVRFSENMPFRSIQLSIKFNYFLIILRSLFFSTIITSLLMIPIIIIFSKSIVNPILKMSNTAKDIAAGNLGIQVDHVSQDEVGNLSDSINFMSKELHKMKIIRDDLLATISHELRSPLGRIKGYTELLIDIQLSKDEIKNYYNSILEEVDLLNSMSGEILEITRLEIGKEVMFKEYIEIDYFISTINEIKKRIQSVNIDVSIEINISNKYGVEVDPDKLTRVFSNLIQNSIKADSNTIIVDDVLTEIKKDGYIYFRIIDNGIGIPEKEMELVFEKFYRVDKSRTRETGGFGLGLSICKRIIVEHNGDIYFVKPENGIGATIIVKLPICNNNQT